VIALLVNPNNAITERIVGDVQEAARVKGRQLYLMAAMPALYDEVGRTACFGIPSESATTNRPGSQNRILTIDKGRFTPRRAQGGRIAAADGEGETRTR
jgi:hypothetical protein